MATTAHWRTILQPGFQAVRENAKPFLIIQGLAVALLVAYYASPGFQAFGSDLSLLKAKWGLLFSGAATAFAGFALPGIVKKALGQPAAKGGADVMFQIGFFFSIGVLVDLLYQLLAQIFGAGTDVATVATKVLVDQLVFSPLISIPLSATAFAWQESGYSFAGLGETFRAGGFLRRYGPMMATCWGFWLPILCVVYALPSGLQFWMFLCAQGAWSLLLVHMGTREVAR